MRREFSVLLSLAVLIAAASVASAAETVFGNSDAQTCFEGARFGGGGNGKQACDRALMDPTLSRSDRAATLVNRGIIYNRTGRLEQAIDDFNAALEINPALGEAYLNRGNSRFFQKRMADAKADYDKAIELKSRDLHAAYFNRGLVHEVLKNPEAARADFEEALRIKPDFVAARARLSGNGQSGEAEPAAAEPAAAEPDAAEPDAAEPDAAEPDAAEPDDAEPDDAEPDPEEPDTGEPGSGDSGSNG